MGSRLLCRIRMYSLLLRALTKGHFSKRDQFPGHVTAYSTRIFGHDVTPVVFAPLVYRKTKFSRYLILHVIERLVRPFHDLRIPACHPETPPRFAAFGLHQ